MAFHWKDRLWRFTSLSFSLSSASFIFTKLMKAIVATLRKLGSRVILYLDDTLVMTPTKEEVRKHLYSHSLGASDSLGFRDQHQESVTRSDHMMEFLGFVLDSNKMTISLPRQKLRSLQRAASTKDQGL